MRKTLIVILNLVIAAAISMPIVVMTFTLLGGDKRALFLIVFALAGTAADELKDIAGSIRTRRYRMKERRIAMGSTSRLVARWQIFKWATAEYQEVFWRKMPRFWLRFAAWSLLAAAGLLLVSIFNSGDAGAKDPCPTTAVSDSTIVPWSIAPHSTTAANAGLMEIAESVPALSAGASGPAGNDYSQWVNSFFPPTATSVVGVPVLYAKHLDAWGYRSHRVVVVDGHFQPVAFSGHSVTVAICGIISCYH